GVAAASLWKKLQPKWQTQPPAGLDPCDVPDDTLFVYQIATGAVGFEARRTSLVAPPELAATYGSNNWAVAPSRTAGGTAILANDPHRAHEVPSLRYIVHLVAPGLNVIGAGEPALPGISIGHNERIAFGLTVFPIDQEDLYVYQADPEDPARYLYRGRYEPVEVVTDTIAVRGRDVGVDVRMEYTRHGPVIKRTDDKIFAVRAGWLEPGMAPYFGSIEYIRAQSWREFSTALNRWGAPAENHVFADVDGNIGYKPAGLFPRRVNYDGLFPVPGDGRYEWQGFFDMDVLPAEFNPERGFVATANAMNLPDDYPVDERRVGFEWSSPWRHQRIFDVLARQPEHTIEDALALQRDYRSLLARRLIDALPRESRRSLAGRMLRRWNGDMLQDAPSAALFSIWYHRYLNPALTLWALGSRQPAATIDSMTVVQLVEWGKLDVLVDDTLDKAFRQTVRVLGHDSGDWRWGDLHKVKFRHPLLGWAEPQMRKQMVMAEYPRGGSGSTTNNTGFTFNDFSVQSGASWRFVVDTGDWDSARMTNAPGQSGDPRSPFFDNLLEGWATDQSFPLLYSREAVERHTAERIELVPATAVAAVAGEQGEQAVE
ncbi:MAG: penicillin acylase family protein, partial [Gammaproteobacteria bacterium]|nr:penicillin acylase family protein [Gammaproteobacteria bacterium]